MLNIICVLYKSQTHILPFLESLELNLKVPAKIVFWDNANDSETLNRFKLSNPEYPHTIQVYGNKKNLGFAGGVNRAIEKALEDESADSFLILNPDALLLSSLSPEVHEKLLKENCVIGLRVFNDLEKRQRQTSARSFPNFLTSIAARESLLTRLWPNNPLSQTYLGTSLDSDNKSKVDWVSGSALFVRRDLWIQLEGFDERFFMFVEDVDLGRKAQQTGIQSCYYPIVDVYHEIGGSYDKRSFKTDLYHHKGMFLYFLKWAPTWQLIFAPLVLGLICLRLIARRLTS